MNAGLPLSFYMPYTTRDLPNRLYQVAGMRLGRRGGIDKDVERRSWRVRIGRCSLGPELSLMQSVIGLLRRTTYDTKSDMRKETLANWHASLAALQNSRACLTFEIPHFESSPSFTSSALPKVSDGARQGGMASQGNSLFYNLTVTTADNGFKIIGYFASPFQLSIAPSCLQPRQLVPHGV